MRNAFFNIILLLFLTGCASVPMERVTSSSPHVDFSLQKIAFQIGETKIHAQERQFGKGRLTMVNLHDDEQASVDAGVAVLEKVGGRLIELTHSGKRRVVFSLDGKDYSFDPNRIFSKAGVRLTVRNEIDRDAIVPEKAHRIVDRFAMQFIQYFKLDRQRAFIALHNNGEGGLSIHSYEPGGAEEAVSKEFYVSAGADPDDFCYVTDQRIFEELKRRKFNVVLQDNRTRHDDGSLSIFAGQHGIRYINVEAEPEHKEGQIRMIENAVELLR